MEKENEEEKEIEIIEENKQIEKQLKDSPDEDCKIVENEKIKRTRLKYIVITIAVVIMILIAFSSIFAITNMNNSNVIQGVYIEGIEISNLSKEEVSKLVNDKISKIDDLELYYGEYETIVKLEEAGIQIEGKDAIQKAINIGKTNNIIIDNYSILKAKLFKTNIELNINFNDEKLKETIKNIQAEIPGAIKNYSYEIKGNELIIKNGEDGKEIDEKLFKKEILKSIKEKFNETENKIEIPTKEAKPDAIDIEKIYNEIHKEAKDAYIVEDPFELHKEEEGIDFKITIEEAKKIISEDKESYTIPLKITKPKVKVKNLGDKLFKQTLVKFTTIYDAGNVNRASNIALAAKTVNGTILLPGETFSYNGILGNTTKEKGYKLGTAYVGGKTVPTYGGGICQVSTTIYNAVLYANLEIVERHNHSYTVSYVPSGRDATVSYGGKDFKFKNNRTYPIKIVANAKNGVVSVSIAGIKEEKEYEIVLSSTVLSTTPYSTVYENTNELPEGKEKVVQSGHNGQKSIAYKTIKYNGKTISKTLLSKDTYKPMTKIVQVGTKKNNITSNTNNNVVTKPEEPKPELPAIEEKPSTTTEEIPVQE